MEERPVFSCPKNIEGECASILSGRYDIPLHLDHPFILDIGANVGAFSYWAYGKFPDCQIRAFEPVDENYEYLKKNCPNIDCCKYMIYPGIRPLYLSNIYPTNHSVHQVEKGQQHLNPPCMHPRQLPDCDLLKIDTEGCEVEILSHYAYYPKAILVESHSEQNLHVILDILKPKYKLIEMKHHLELAEMKWIRRDLVPSNIMPGMPRC